MRILLALLGPLLAAVPVQAQDDVAACVGRPSATRLSQDTVSSAIGPRNSPSAMSPGG